MNELSDNPEIRQSLSLLAESGDTVAQAKLSLLLFGSKTPGASDTGRAHELLDSVGGEEFTLEFFRSEAANLNPAAHYGLFIMWKHSLIEVLDNNVARRHLITAAEMGLAIAQNTLGLKYKNGSDGFEQNAELAESLFLKAVEGGVSHSRYFLYLIYSDKEGDLYNLEQAFEQANLSVEEGSHQDMARLASMYESGIGVDENLIQAAKWYFFCLHVRKNPGKSG